jgi:hypothetical protein
VLTYGSGTVTATLSTVLPATGSVTLAEDMGGTAITLGTAILNAGDLASFDISPLPAGTHRIVATYPGDATHGAAQSSALAVTVTPLTVSAMPAAVAILYGQAVPPLNGVLSGVLPQDAGKVSALFTTAAGTQAAAGNYPITVTLTGGAAADYLAVVTPANLTIARAPTLTSLSTSTSNLIVGLPITLNAQAVSTTSGVPTGSVTLMDGATAVSIVPLLAAGVVTLTTTSLGLGSHTLSAVYPGDANFLSSTSAAATVVVGAGSDFSLTSTDAVSQSAPAGSTATFHFSVAMQGVPSVATAFVSPASIPPGSGLTNFVVTIQTPFAGLEGRPRPFGSRPSGAADSGVTGFLAVLLLPAIVRKRTGNDSHKASRKQVFPLRIAVKAGFCILFTSLATGCGDRVNTASEFSHATTYTITVTGTATGPAGNAIQHSANVTLEVL